MTKSKMPTSMCIFPLSWVGITCLVCASYLLVMVIGFSTPTSTARCMWLSGPPKSFQHRSEVLLTRLHMVSSSQKTSGSKASSSSPTGGEGATMTLYDILQAPHDASRADLKRQYIILAKTLHPDAALAFTNTNQQQQQQQHTDPDVGFPEVAAAWKTLSDPVLRKRYDRSLQAEILKEEVELAATVFFEQTAIPLVRRTTATTAAILEAAMSSDHNDDLLLAVWRAGLGAGRNMDRLEWSEQSAQLYQRAKDKQEERQEVQDRLAEATRQRRELAVRLPHVPLSAKDALSVCRELDKSSSSSSNNNNNNNYEDSFALGSVWNNRRLRALRSDIVQLRLLEQRHSNVVIKEEKLQSEKRQSQDELDRAQQDYQNASVEAERLRRLLEEAEQRVGTTQQRASECARQVASLDPQLQRASSEREKSNLTWHKRRDTLREGLARELGVEVTLDNGHEDDYQSFVNEEETLRAESAQLKEQTNRLQSRAKTLQEKSDMLQEYPESSFDEMKP